MWKSIPKTQVTIAVKVYPGWLFDLLLWRNLRSLLTLYSQAGHVYWLGMIMSWSITHFITPTTSSAIKSKLMRPVIMNRTREVLLVIITRVPWRHHSPALVYNNPRFCGETITHQRQQLLLPCLETTPSGLTGTSCRFVARPINLYLLPQVSIFNKYANLEGIDTSDGQSLCHR